LIVNGNVGIGTTGPTDRLDVAGNIRAPFWYDRDNTGYYVDPNSYSNMWMVNRQRGYNSVEYDYNDTAYYVNPNGSSRFNYMGRNYGFNWTEYDWNNTAYYVDPNNTSIYNDLRANIFYDRQNTGYYVDPNGTSNMNAITAATRARWGLPDDWTNRPSITSDINYWTGAQGWGTVNFNTLPTYGSTFFDTWSNPGNQPPGTSHWQGVQAFHYWNGSTGYGSQIAFGSPMMNGSLFVRSIWGGGWSSWYKLWTEGNDGAGSGLDADLLDGLSSGSFRQFNTWQSNHYSGTNGAEYATIFYDTNNSAYYADPSSTSRMWYGNFSYLHTTVNDSWFPYTGNGYNYFRGTTYAWNAVWYDENDSNYQLDPNGSTHLAELQANIMYDHNNTGYYVNPASTSRMNEIQANRVYGFTDIRSPIYYDYNNTGYYVDPNSNSRIANLYVNNNLINWPGYNGITQAPGSYIWPGRTDGGSWQQSWYLASNASWGLYSNTSFNAAGGLYDAQRRVATSRGEGTNFVDYSRYVYNNGAYSGSGWIEPSNLGVRYANSANSATYATYINTDSYNMKLHWSGQGGQPTWLWGSNNGTDAYVWNPSNFSVNYANSAGTATNATTTTQLNSGNARIYWDGSRLVIKVN